MLKVWQTEFGSAGNCYAACLATVLRCELSDVPDFRSMGDEWGAAVRQWAGDRGVAVLFLPGSDRPPPGTSVASCRVLDGTIHAVVYQDGRMIHDPAGRPFWTPDSPVLLWTLIRGVQ